MPRSRATFAWTAVAVAAVVAGACLGVWHARHASAPARLDSDLFESDLPASAKSAEKDIRAIVGAEGTVPNSGTVPLRIDYPLDGSVFPPEIVAPTFLFRDPSAKSFLIRVGFADTPHKIHVLTSGRRELPDPDPLCTRDDTLTPDDAPALSPTGWTPTPRIWSIIKSLSSERDATVEVFGVSAGHILSRGSVRIAMSKDPVDAMVFYRDVPLMPATGKDGVIKPLKDEAVVLIKWRLRDISKPAAPVVLEGLPTCGNCHSFSSDGRTLSMDIDGPDGDKGAHIVKALSKRTVIGAADVFSWNNFREGDTKTTSYGVFPRISPDGRYVAATVHESMYVQNYEDYRFLQTFYPTHGVLAYFDRETRTIRRLHGADHPAFVQSNPVWSPDGKEIVFIRAPARDSYPPGKTSAFAGDPSETAIDFDLYRVPFNAGRGGEATPVEGASNNGVSNSFPKFSPDGKWIVFVESKNGLLMRPDGKLCILPASGGTPRVMRCNTPRMNSWHSWSPNGRWLVFSSKWLTPYTQMFLTHVDENGNDTPPVLVPDSTAPNRAVNLPEFANLRPGDLEEITTPAVDYRRHTLAAKKLIEAGKLDEALAELKTSLDLKPDFPETLASYGSVLADKGRMSEAESYFRKALEIEPLYYPACNNWGIALGREGRVADAEARFREALEIYPKCDSAHYNWGNVLLRAGRPAEALEHFRAAARINPSGAEAWNNIGGVLAQQGKPAEAIENFRRAVEADPKYAPAHYNLGVLLQRAGALDEAAAQFRKVLDLNPQHAGARRHLDEIGKRAP